MLYPPIPSNQSFSVSIKCWLYRRQLPPRPKSLTRARSFLPPGEAVHGVSAMHPCPTVSAAPSSHHGISGGNTHMDESNLNMGYFARQLQGIYHVSKDDNHPQELLRGYSLVGFLLKSLRPISACVSRRRGDETAGRMFRAAC